MVTHISYLANIVVFCVSFTQLAKLTKLFKYVVCAGGMHLLPRNCRIAEHDIALRDKQHIKYFNYYG